MMEDVQVQHLTFVYGKEKAVLNDISFQVSAGESVGLIGANGVGKSTLLKILVGLLLDYTGRVTVRNFPVQKENLAAIRQQVGYVFQDSESQLFMPTVYEDIAFAPRNYGYSEGQVQQRVMQALRLVQIEHLKDRQIYRLSGGEKKMVSLATVLAMEPEIIFLDEPSVALDPRNRRNLIGILNGIKKTKIIASHDLDFIWDTCDRTILLANGRIVESGNTKEILKNKKLLEQNGLELPLSLSICEFCEKNRNTLEG